MAFPNLPGVPKLKKAIIPNGADVIRSGFGIIQATGWNIVSGLKVWGIFDSDGKPVFDSQALSGIPNSSKSILNAIRNTSGLRTTHSFNGIDYSKEYRISEFQIEDGGFASYNKTELPGIANVTLCMGGSDKDRKKFVETLKKISGDLNLYTITTPDNEFKNYNISRFDYSKTSSSGAYLIVANIELRQIRFVKSLRVISEEKKPIENAKQASGNSTKDGGITQSKVPDNRSLLKKGADWLGGFIK